MTVSPRGERYSNIAIAFHWTIAVLVIANLAIGIGRGLVPALRPLMGAHKAIGITVLVLTAGRVVWRLAHRAPALPANVAAWERGAAHATHAVLYLLMIAMPVSGWLMVSGSVPPRPVRWFGLFDIPPLPVGKDLAGAGANAHGLLGWLMVALVVLHIAAALRHHLILRDRVLLRMMPSTRR